MMPTTLARKSGRPPPSVLCAPVGPPGKRAAARSSVTVPGRPPAMVPAACASPSRQRMPRHACPFAAPTLRPGGCPAPAPAQAGKGCATARVLCRATSPPSPARRLPRRTCASPSRQRMPRRARLVAAPPRRPLRPGRETERHRDTQRHARAAPCRFRRRRARSGLPGCRKPAAGSRAARVPSLSRRHPLAMRLRTAVAWGARRNKVTAGWPGEARKRALL
jgi:hypothetical protein